MKKVHIILLSLLAIIFTSCIHTYNIYTPEYMSYSELRSSFNVESEEFPPMTNPGKIYLKNDLLFVGERNLGVHVIDISNISLPTQIAFLEIPGNRDISILEKDSHIYLYADSFIDLLVLELTIDGTIFNAEEIYRLEEIFPNDPYQYFIDDPLSPWFGDLDLTDQVVISYTTETATEWDSGMLLGTDMVMESGTDSSSGTGGSMARFTLYGDQNDSWFLYTVDSFNLKVFDLSLPDTPQPEVNKNLGWGIETIFPYKTQLYIGSDSAMYLYDLTNPANPEELAVVQHFTSRDPVVVGPVGPDLIDTAFVTLRSENGWGVDELKVYNVSNPADPEELFTLDMWNPHGLGLNNSRLFVCEGSGGLKAFNVDSLYDTSLSIQDRLPKEAQITGMDTYDIIALDQVKIVIGDDGLYLYNYSPGTFVLESSIIVE